MEAYILQNPTIYLKGSFQTNRNISISYRSTLYKLCGNFRTYNYNSSMDTLGCDNANLFIMKLSEWIVGNKLTGYLYFLEGLKSENEGDVYKLLS